MLVAASEDISKTSGSFSILQHLQGHRQMWAPEVTFIITICLDAFIFIFFLAGIDKSVEFFENNPDIGKHLVINFKLFDFLKSNLYNADSSALNFVVNTLISLLSLLSFYVRKRLYLWYLDYFKHGHL